MGRAVAAGAKGGEGRIVIVARSEISRSGLLFGALFTFHQKLPPSLESALSHCCGPHPLWRAARLAACAIASCSLCLNVAFYKFSHWFQAKMSSHSANLFTIPPPGM